LGWDKANTGTVYDPELFRRKILPRLGTVPLAEIMEAAGCCKASAPDYWRGKRTAHVFAWTALAAIKGEIVMSGSRPTIQRARRLHLLRADSLW
jgi:hypothetical protein